MSDGVSQHFTFSQTDVAYAAFHGDGSFAAAGPDPKLRMLIALYPEAFTVVARADTGIRDFQDLRGKRVGIGKSGAGCPFTRDVVLGVYGWTPSDLEHGLELKPTEQKPALCGNQVDAIFEAAHPNGLTQEATTSCRGRLVRMAGHARSIGFSRRIPFTSPLLSPAAHVYRQPRRCPDNRHAGRARQHRAISRMSWLMPRRCSRISPISGASPRAIDVGHQGHESRDCNPLVGALNHYREAGLSPFVTRYAPIGPAPAATQASKSSYQRRSSGRNVDVQQLAWPIPTSRMQPVVRSVPTLSVVGVCRYAAVLAARLRQPSAGGAGGSSTGRRACGGTSCA